MDAIPLGPRIIKIGWDVDSKRVVTAEEIEGVEHISEDGSEEEGEETVTESEGPKGESEEGTTDDDDEEGEELREERGRGRGHCRAGKVRDK